MRERKKTSALLTVYGLRRKALLEHDPEKLADFSDKIMRPDKEHESAIGTEAIALERMIS